MQDWFSHLTAMQKTNIRNSILKTYALLVGRKTYEMISSHRPHQLNDDNGLASKINSMKKFVVSPKLVKADWNNSIIIKKK